MPYMKQHGQHSKNELKCFDTTRHQLCGFRLDMDIATCHQRCGFRSDMHVATGRHFCTTHYQTTLFISTNNYRKAAVIMRCMRRKA